MYVYGQLKRAQLECFNSAPSSGITGRVFYRYDISRVYFDTSALLIPILANDQNIVIGTNGTAANNLRLYRSGAGKLQLTTGSDSTAEGTPSTTVGQFSHALEQYTNGTRPAASANAVGQVILNTTDFTIEFQDGTNWYRQFNGGTASNTQRLIAPSNTLSSLNALTRKAGVIAYATDQTALYFDNGTSLTKIAAAAYTAPTLQKFTATGTTAGYLFTISTSTTCAAGDTYTNNGNTYTVITALSAQSGQVLFMSGASAPTASGTLTRSSGAGTASVTFTSNVAIATYTTPAGVLYLRVRMVGGGGGGGGSGSSSGTAATAGTTTAFGVLIANGGSAGARDSDGATGGSASLGSGPIGIAFTGGFGGSSGRQSSSPPNTAIVGGHGGISCFGGAGAGGSTGGTGAGLNAIANTGAGGGGAEIGFVTSGVSGAGGGAGGFVDAVIGSPAATYWYVVGTGGTGQTLGTSGSAGGNGAAGILVVEEYYQ